MCIKNQDVEKMLKGIRRIEKGEIDSMSAEELGEVLVVFKSLSDDFEKVEKQLRSVLMEAEMLSGEILMFPQFERKVQIKEGRKNTIINAADVMLTMKNYGVENQFPDIVNVVKSKVDQIPEDNNAELISDIVKQFSTTEQGKPYLAVSKMAKADF